MKYNGPWGLPMSQGEWYKLVILGFCLSLLSMGLVHEATAQTLAGPVSVAETAGLALFIAWAYALGPVSPLSANR